MHPLRNLKYTLSLPYLSYIPGNFLFSQVKEEEKIPLANNDQLKEAALENGFSAVSDEIIRKNNLKEDNSGDGQQSDDDFLLEEGEDAMSRLGAGIISYFTLIKVSFFLFVLASLVSVPLLS